MPLNRTLRTALVLAATLYPALAYAHVGVGETSGFAHGFTHPISGLDHVLAMILVGVFAFQLGGRALWLVPLSFVGMMAAGGIMSMNGIHVPLIELGIALSVIVLGTAVAFEVKAPVAIAAGLAGLFAIFHGYAHVAEMPGGAGAWSMQVASCFPRRCSTLPASASDRSWAETANGQAHAPCASSAVFLRLLVPEFSAARSEHRPRPANKKAGQYLARPFLC